MRLGALTDHHSSGAGAPRVLSSRWLAWFHQNVVIP